MGSPLGVEDIYIFGRILVRSSYIGNEGKSRSEQLIGATQYKEKSKSGYSQTVGCSRSSHPYHVRGNY